MITGKPYLFSFLLSKSFFFFYLLSQKDKKENKSDQTEIMDHLKLFFFSLVSQGFNAFLLAERCIPVEIGISCKLR